VAAFSPVPPSGKLRGDGGKAVTVFIGITGGIATGKSTVSHMLKELGYPVVDADLLVREVQRPGEEVYRQIVEKFGGEILLENGEINRKKLGDIVFTNPEKRRLLNAIVHPAVRRRMREEKERALKEREKALFLDIPLLFESGLFSEVDKVMVVYADEKTQLERLMKRNNLTKEEAYFRIRSQMPIEEKRRRADRVIDNRGPLENTKKQLLEILAEWGISREGPEEARGKKES
jgi:dephospho-CoA kinase